MTLSRTGAVTADLPDEVIWRKSDDSGVRTITSRVQTEHTTPTLMQDRQYRPAISWLNESYDQPPWPSYYLGYDM